MSCWYPELFLEKSLKNNWSLIVFFSRWWETPGWGSVQQRCGLSLRRRQKAPSGEEVILPVSSQIVRNFSHPKFWTSTFSKLRETHSLFPLGSFSARKRQFRHFYVNSCTENVNMDSNTELLLFYLTGNENQPSWGNIFELVDRYSTSNVRAKRSPHFSTTRVQSSTFCSCGSDSLITGTNWYLLLYFSNRNSST